MRETYPMFSAANNDSPLCAVLFSVSSRFLFFAQLADVVCSFRDACAGSVPLHNAFVRDARIDDDRNMSLVGTTW